ncbi:MAG: hypothetical protein IKY47_04935, partial [Bacteroidaceae bacterium]|nr:hypothetical protein [Bacteroidaceae bacterium]
SRRIVKSAVTETSIVKGSLKTTTRYLPCGRYDKYDENEGADREKVKTEKSKLKTGNTSGVIPGRTIRTPQSCNKLQSSSSFRKRSTKYSYSFVTLDLQSKGIEAGVY